MRRRILFGLIGLAVAIGVGFGVWTVAYAQGQSAGRADVAAARAEFIQGRSGGPGGPGAVGTPPAGGGAGSTQPGGAGAGQGGPGGPAARGGGLVAGTIDKVDGTKVTVAADGGPVIVTLGEQTQIRRQVSATPSDLKAGDRVVVMGQRGSDGAMTAMTIQIQPQGQ